MQGGFKDCIAVFNMPDRFQCQRSINQVNSMEVDEREELTRHTKFGSLDFMMLTHVDKVLILLYFHCFLFAEKGVFLQFVMSILLVLLVLVVTQVQSSLSDQPIR